MNRKFADMKSMKSIEEKLKRINFELEQQRMGIRYTIFVPNAQRSAEMVTHIAITRWVNRGTSHENITPCVEPKFIDTYLTGIMAGMKLERGLI